ncbi:uncharacterized protein LOC144103894 isoform X3 [Amblyomma americanum]
MTPIAMCASGKWNATHCQDHGLPAIPEPVPGSQQRMVPPATAQGVSSTVATHPGGAPNANNTASPPRTLAPGSLYDAASDTSLSTSNAISTSATGPIQRHVRTEPTAPQSKRGRCTLVPTLGLQLSCSAHQPLSHHSRQIKHISRRRPASC